ncbi:MAG: hypothetical protein AAF596_10635 [Planctomycetota bacterium]
MISATAKTWLTLSVLAVAAWFVTASAGDGSPAAADSTLGTKKLKTHFVALRDNDERRRADAADYADDYDDGEQHFDEDEAGDGRFENDEEYDEDYDDEDYDDERDLDEFLERLEIERMELEVRQAELQAAFGELELLQEFAKIAEDADTTASLAVMAAGDTMEPDELIPFLNEVLEKSSSVSVRRVARMKLAEAYSDTDQVSEAKGQIRALALGE